MDVSEATISQFETGKNRPTNEKIALFTEICGQTFNFDLDRNLIIDRVYDIYDFYTDLKKEELNETIKIVKDTHNIACSYARFEYYLILYMDAIIKVIRNQIGSTKSWLQKLQGRKPYVCLKDY